MGIKKKQGHRCVADMMKSVFFVIDDCAFLLVTLAAILGLYSINQENEKN